ncbi:YopX family protein [Enterococcus faecium]|uniref:YopX family protein n=1 Tax=Enterococcus faecium TaxID=1352 RepID=UPI00035453B1|nr:YopX family protein [Enterococcus faecium]EPI26575.1 phage hypothetical protein [Enterococcus faecium LA4B-2]
MIPKFRAWDKKTETIQEVESISFKEKKLVINQKSVAWFNSDYIRNFDDIELMQSTGLKDKNGVEMFEGDIVIINVNNGFDRLFDEKSVIKESKFHSGLICKLVKFDAEYRIFHDPIFDYEYEVIGNIYENSELLEEQQ